MRFFVLVLALFSMMNPVSAALKTGDVFGDWAVSCEKTPDGKALCHLFQTLNNKENQERVLNVAVGYPNGKDQLVAIFTAPLGIALLPGVQVVIGEGSEPIRVPVAQCIAEGCRAFLALDEQKLNAMLQKNALIFTFANMKKEGFNVKVSLKGFAAGFEMLKGSKGLTE